MMQGIFRRTEVHGKQAKQNLVLKPHGYIRTLQKSMLHANFFLFPSSAATLPW